MSRQANPKDLFPLTPELPLPADISEIELQNFLSSVRLSDALAHEMINYCHQEQDLGLYIFVRAINNQLSGQKKPAFLYRSLPPEQLE